MRKLFGMTAVLVLLTSATGCESCLFRGEKPPAYPRLCAGLRACLRLWRPGRLFDLCAADGVNAWPSELIAN